MGVVSRIEEEGEATYRAWDWLGFSGSGRCIGLSLRQLGEYPGAPRTWLYQFFRGSSGDIQYGLLTFVTLRRLGCFEPVLSATSERGESGTSASGSS